MSNAVPEPETHENGPKNQPREEMTIESPDDKGDKPNKTSKHSFFAVATSIRHVLFPKEEEVVRQRKWKNRRIRHQVKKLGGVKKLDGEDSVDGATTFYPLKKKPSVLQYAKEAATKVARRKKVKTEDTVDNGFTDAVFGRNQDPREFGVGAIGEILNIEQNSEHRPRFVRQQLDEMDDYRPFFSYWISTVQTIIMIIAIARYGFAKIDIELTVRSDFVRTERLT